MNKLNCWEVRKCGKGPLDTTDPKNICPASTDKRLNGVHGGKNAGRACWVIEGTLCDNEVQGHFSEKLDGCLECDFYEMVMRDERPDFENPGSLLAKLKDQPSEE